MTQEIDLADDGETYSITLDGEYDIHEVDDLSKDYFREAHDMEFSNMPPLDTPIEGVTTGDGETVVEFALEHFDRAILADPTDAEIEETLEFVEGFEEWWNAK